MDWSRFVEAASEISWLTYLGTADSVGKPHVSVVAPGYREGAVWFASRPESKKIRNISENPDVGFHWPVGGGGPGELAAWGRARIDDGDKARIWEAGIFTYDLEQFFGSSEDPAHVFVEVTIDRARLMGPEFVVERYP